MVVVHRSHGFRFVVHLHEPAHVRIIGAGLAKDHLLGPDGRPEVVDGAGFNLHWPALDADLYVPALVAGLFGTRDWMAREWARMAGSTATPAKAAAARTNGAKGGRPRKSRAG